MTIERSAWPFGDDQARQRVDGARLTLTAAKKYLESALRKAISPGGVTGVVMALLFIVVTDAFLMLTKYIQELPPVSLTFLIPVVVAAMRWGTLSATVTAIGGAGTVSFFFYKPFFITRPPFRSRVPCLFAFFSVFFVFGFSLSQNARGHA